MLVIIMVKFSFFQSSSWMPHRKRRISSPERTERTERQRILEEAEKQFPIGSIVRIIQGGICCDGDTGIVREVKVEVEGPYNVVRVLVEITNCVTGECHGTYWKLADCIQLISPPPQVAYATEFFTMASPYQTHMTISGAVPNFDPTSVGDTMIMVHCPYCGSDTMVRGIPGALNLLRCPNCGETLIGKKEEDAKEKTKEEPVVVHDRSELVLEELGSESERDSNGNGRKRSQ